MSERIDHAGEARALLMAADSDVSLNHPTNTGETKGDILANALVHATLALVEQQEIANRVALAVAIRKDIQLRDTATELSDWLNDGNGTIGYFSEAEQERLGIA